MIVHDDSSIIHPAYILSNLLKEGQYKKFAEIGVWRTKNVKYILSDVYGLIQSDLIDEYWAVDPWKVMTGAYNGAREVRTKEYWDRCREAIASQEKWDRHHKWCCKLMFTYPQLRVLRMTSKEAAEMFPNRYLDMVYIDAIHTFEHVYADIGYWLPKVRKGGIIGGHDYGEERRWIEVRDAVHKRFGDNIEVWLKNNVWIKKI